MLGTKEPFTIILPEQCFFFLRAILKDLERFSTYNTNNEFRENLKLILLEMTKAERRKNKIQ